MILTYQQERFICFASYDERHIPKGAGFRWDGANKTWHTIDPDAASRLHGFADEMAREKLSLHTYMRKAALEESRSEGAEGDIPCPPGLAYLPYQRAGIMYALRRFEGKSSALSSLGKEGGLPGSGVLIADEPGL